MSFSPFPVSSCVGCARNAGQSCLAFREPCRQWATGKKCWAFTRDDWRVQMELRDARKYAELKGVAG